MTPPNATTEPVLIVDDEPRGRALLARGLRAAGIQCATANDGAAALERLGADRYAVIICESALTVTDGAALVPRLLARDPDLIIVLVTTVSERAGALEASRPGVYDYLTRPYQLNEAVLVIRRALEHRRLLSENRDYHRRLDELIEQRSLHAHGAALSVITSLSLALEAKDEYTHDHSRRVAALAAALGEQLGCPPGQIADLRLAGLLHDIGKIGVRESVLLKCDPLTRAEFDHIKQHPDLGARILAPVSELQHIIPLIRHHHERWDGGGYPDGLAGAAIPPGARILAVADAYVAMRERRPYRQPLRRDDALNEIRIGARRQFDLEVVRVLLQLAENGELDRLDSEFPEEILFEPLAAGHPDTERTRDEPEPARVSAP
jgi:putative two-component system response regulator